MFWLKLSLQSLRNRLFASVLTVLSIALSVMLLLGVEKARESAEEGFTQAISNTDLIVGARSGPIQLILYTVFNMGSATHNISYETWQKFSQHPAVEWTIPYSLGDGHRGFRVVGTTENFFKHYSFAGDQQIQFQEGQAFSGLWDVVIGADVAKELQYKLGQKIVIAHGVTKGEGILKHDDKPFTVVGVLDKTGTPVDRAVYVSLLALEALHIDWQSGAAPTPDTAISADQIKESDLKVQTITSFFLRTKSRIETLRLQREINEYGEEPLLAIIPGATLSELWRSLSYVEQVLKLISWMVVGVGLLAMLIALMTTLNERRREMAILRSLGAGPSHILGLLMFESTLLTAAGVALGVVMASLLTWALRPWLLTEFGFNLQGSIWGLETAIYILATLILGTLTGIIPALRASSLALKDGLSVRN